MIQFGEFFSRSPVGVNESQTSITCRQNWADLANCVVLWVHALGISNICMLDCNTHLRSLHKIGDQYWCVIIKRVVPRLRIFPESHSNLEEASKIEQMGRDLAEPNGSHNDFYASMTSEERPKTWKPWKVKWKLRISNPATTTSLYWWINAARNRTRRPAVLYSILQDGAASKVFKVSVKETNLWKNSSVRLVTGIPKLKT